MNNKIKPYCQIKYSCNHKFTKNLSLQRKREKGIHDDYPGEFYIEEYHDFKTLIERIDNFYDEVVQRYQSRGMDKYSKDCSFPIYIICNRFGEYRPIGISAYGWDISMYFFSYLNKYLENHYGKEEGLRKYLQFAQKSRVFFYLNQHLEPSIIPACDLVSEETAHIILKQFLDGKKEQDLEPNIFYREIQKRNY